MAIQGGNEKGDGFDIINDDSLEECEFMGQRMQ